MAEPLLVSIITIFFNAERFLAEAIASVRAQTHPHWELLLVDDGSTDASAALARAAAAADPARIRVLAHPDGTNHGMSATRNLGLRHARGACIAFLDADDHYHPEKLARQLAVLDAHPRAAMVYGATCQRWEPPEGGGAPREKLRRLGVPPGTLAEPPHLAAVWLDGRGETPATCGALIRREAIDAVGGFENSFRGMFEDQAFFYKLALAFPVFVESGTWDVYRRHDASAVAVATRAGTYDASGASASDLAFLRWLGAYLTRTSAGDAEVRRAFDVAMWPYRHPWRYRLQRLLRKVRPGR